MKHMEPNGPRVTPPLGDDPDQVLARQRFWIEHGNGTLRSMGRDDLHWACVNGHYFIEPRP